MRRFVSIRVRSALLLFLAPLPIFAQHARSVEEAEPLSTWVDYDGDGVDDLVLVLPSEGLRLLRGGGDGRFEDVTEVAGLNALATARSVEWADADGDADPDLVAVTRAGELLLFVNEGGTLFERTPVESGFASFAGVVSATWHDFDRDELPDLLVRTTQTITLQRNVGEARFEPLLLGPLASTLDAAPVAMPALGGVAIAIEGEEGTQLEDAIDVARGSSASNGAAEEPGVLSDPDQVPSAGKSRSNTRRAVAAGSLPTSPTTRAANDALKLAPLDIWVNENGDTMTGTLTLNPSGDQALDLASGSLYKDGELFMHTKGGVWNTAVGTSALINGSTGAGNTANGFGALRDNTTGNFNTASGASALRYNTTGFFNTASGATALFSNTTGFYNTASGAAALRSNTTGNRNTATGVDALRSNTTGSYNTASGATALFSNTDGSDNTASGESALSSNTTGSYNTASGRFALGSNTTGFFNTASGASALGSNTTGIRNTASGGSALSSNTTGSYNTASGRFTLFSNTTGYSNTASGASALASNTTGISNTASGVNALAFNTTGYFNTAGGVNALLSNTTGAYNTASGTRSLSSNTTGYSNTASGYKALYSNTTGNNNIALGYGAGYSQTTGSNNIAIGNLGVAGDDATIRIGTPGTHATTTIAGDSITLGDGAMAKAEVLTAAGHAELHLERSSTSKDGSIRFRTGGPNFDWLVGMDNGPSTHNSDFSIKSTNNATPELVVTTAGRVGIGRTPASNNLEVEGTASKTTASSWLANSDRRIKTNVREIDDALEQIEKLRLVGFHYTDDYMAKHPVIQDIEYFNVIAQEFADVFPDYVQSSGDDSGSGDEFLQVDTYPALMHAVAAIQQLAQRNREVHDRLGASEARESELKRELAEIRQLLTLFLEEHAD